MGSLRIKKTPYMKITLSCQENPDLVVTGVTSVLSFRWDDII
jgi:hypothetical protein